MEAILRANELKFREGVDTEVEGGDHWPKTTSSGYLRSLRNRLREADGRLEVAERELAK
jgi:hypothetical protein